MSLGSNDRHDETTRNTWHPTRRSVLGGGAAVATIAVTSALSTSGPARAATSTPSGGTRVTSGTDFAVAVSPDGSHLAMDMLGVLWVCSSSGGTARRLTSDLYDIAQPDWSPDNSTLIFQSYRDGAFNLWTIRPDGSRVQQLTQGPFDHREPRYSPDGTKVAFSSDVGGSYGIHILDLKTGLSQALVDSPLEEYEPAWSPDGRRIAFVTADTRIDIVDVGSGTRITYVSVPSGQVIHQPSWMPNGSDIAYHLFHDGKNDLMAGTKPLVQDEEVFPFRASFTKDWRYFYTSGGVIRTRRAGSNAVGTVGFTAALRAVTPKYQKGQRNFDGKGSFPVVGIGSPVLSPDGTSIAFRALNDIYTMDIGGKPTPLFNDRWWKCDPDWSPDGRRLAFVTDRTGTLNIWIRDLATGRDAQLTHLSDSAALSARWSPDASEIAFLDQDGALWVVDAATGDLQKIFDATFEPGRPSWSPDGNHIALAAVVPYSRRYREGLSKILVVNRHTGEGTYVDPAPHRSLQTRGDDGPVWSPDGTKLAFAMESVLWVLPVDPSGRPTGTARRVTTELSDTPSWGGDSTTLLYLNGGKLKTVQTDGRGGRTIPHHLTWRNATGPDQLVVHAGRMWDGTTSPVRTNVDILISGHRILGVEPHRDGRAGTLVDASNRFVMPGLIDIHHHREMQGYAYGSRQGPLWLSLGITTTRSPGSPAYHMVEERESVQAGLRVAPRYFGTGEAIDGPRIYYNFMRPTYSHDQLGLELERASKLDYDLMKCYVRLPVVWHKEVIDWAHSTGRPVTSHYHYPAIALGGDGTEHIGATNRFGYSRTITNVGSAYSDVIAMFNDSKMARTPTLFVSSTLYKEDTSLVTDARVQRMYPNWRMAKLQDSVTSAQTTDQSVNRANLAHQVAQIVEMVRGGGVVTAGTDSPIDHLAVSLHMNLRAMVKYGLTPREALVSATSRTGKYLGEPLGQIAPGMYADLAIVDGDPLTSIEDAANVTAVLTGGRPMTVDELLAPYESATTTSVSPPSATARPEGKVKPRVQVHPSSAKFWWNSPEELERARTSCNHDH